MYPLPICLFNNDQFLMDVMINLVCRAQMVQEERASSLRVLDTLRQHLKAAAGREATYTGVLYGLHLEGERLVVGATGKEGGGDLELFNEMLPCGIEPIGVFGIGGEGIGGLEKLASQLPALSQVQHLTWNLFN